MGERKQFWFDRFVNLIRLPHPLFLVFLNAILYLIGLLLAVQTNNFKEYLSQPRWVLMAVFGFLNGLSVLYAVRNFQEALDSTKPLLRIEENEWLDVKNELVNKTTSPTYWVIIVFWLFFSYYHLISTGSGWWSIGTVYHHPEIMSLYGYVYQGISGCFLGGMQIGVVSINLNRAYRSIATQEFYTSDIITKRGKSLFKPVKRFIFLNTALTLILIAIGMSIWIEVYLPISTAASLIMMFIPTVIIPHYFFHDILSKAKEEKLEKLNQDITSIMEGERDVSIRELIRFEGLLREEDRLEHESAWFFDLHGVLELLAVTIIHVILIEALTTILHSH
jgi:hypothetical protein